MATSESSSLSHKEEDDLLLDANGDFRSGQREPTPSKRPVFPTPIEKLTPDNFRLVRHQSDRVRSFVHNKDKSRAFLDYNLRLQQQQLRPKWMHPSPSMPLLPGYPFSAGISREMENYYKQM